jgi:hypothetical protein
MASGDRERARELADATAADYAASGFGWPRYLNRLRAVNDMLSEP